MPAHKVDCQPELPTLPQNALPYLRHIAQGLGICAASGNSLELCNYLELDMTW